MDTVLKGYNFTIWYIVKLIFITTIQIMKFEKITAISPIDGRYSDKTKDIKYIFSEFALIKYRLLIEIRWLQEISANKDITEVSKFDDKTNNFLNDIINNFSIADALQIKKIEDTTNHDVKAVEYFLKDKISVNKDLVNVIEFIHFACTSEDINNLSHALMLKQGRIVLLEKMHKVLDLITALAKNNADLSMLSRTHGQTASPTTLGKEMANFSARLKRQIQQFEQVAIMGKFNGAVGNFNAHIAVYPNIAWDNVAKNFVESLGVNYAAYTTQIEPHDYIAEYFHAMNRFNNILIDFCRDIWSYISIGYFKQKIIAGEVGSSTMPHKVNPIDFENAEGNLGIANAIGKHLADKLQISRWQRDLSDSTVLRNLGVSCAHSIIAFSSIIKGIAKLEIDKSALIKDLDKSWEVLAEAIQTVMRRYRVEKPYEKLKTLTRGQAINSKNIADFINNLEIPETAKKELLNITPKNYIGNAINLAKDI